MRKEKKKKCENKKGCAFCRAFAAAIASLLSAAPAGMRDEQAYSARRNFHEQFRRKIKDEQSQSVQKQNKPSAMPVLGNAFFLD